MIRIEHLKKRWESSARFRALRAAMSLEKEGLLISAGTVLAHRNADNALALVGEEARLLALLSVASGRPVNTSIPGTIAKASKNAQAGDECMAASSRWRDFRSLTIRGLPPAMCSLPMA